MDLKLKITPVPRPLWGKSLNKLWPEWQAFRESLIEQRGRDCQIRGARPERLSDLEADEEWCYDTSTDPAVARVAQIVLRCGPCHDCKHWLLQNKRYKEGKITGVQMGQLRQHFCRVNSIQVLDFDCHRKAAKQEFDRLSALLRWRIDFRPYWDRVMDVPASGKRTGPMPEEQALLFDSQG